MNWLRPTHLVEISWWIQPNPDMAELEILPVEVEEIHQNASKVGLLLALGHVLQQTCYQASDRETSQSTSWDFIEAPDQQELLNHRKNDWHRGKLGLPLLEGLVRDQPTVVVKRHINTQPSQLVNELENWNSSMRNALNRVGDSDVRSFQKT